MPILPLADVKMAESLRSLGFSEPVCHFYKDGILVEKDEVRFFDYNSQYADGFLSAPALQEAQVWIGRRKRLDVLVYRETFFDQIGKYYAVIINRKDGMLRETGKYTTYNLALEAGLRAAIDFLGKKKRRRRKK